MKRKLITTLLTTEQLDEAVKKAVPASAGDKPEMARTILEAIVKDAAGDEDQAAEVYRSILEATPEDLGRYLNKPKARRRDLLTAQKTLIEALTSKAGRPKSSQYTRKEQQARAQKRRRGDLKKAGKKPINAWVRPEARTYLNLIKKKHHCNNQGEALEAVLEAAMRGEILKTEE